MQKKKKVLVLLTIASSSLAITVAASFIGKGSGFRTGVGADACAAGQHSGNHYLANAATCGEAGNAEFWACCECQQQFLSNPGGNFADCGAYAGAPLASTHIAYVAPTGEHAYGYHAKIEDGIVYLVESCNDCGEVHGDPIKQMDQKVNATFEIDVTSLTYGWTKNEETGVWTSSNKGIGSSQSHLVVTVLTAGVITFDYTSSGEGAWDYLFFGPNTSYGAAYVNCKANSGTDAHNVSGTYTRDVAVGDQIYFIFTKDSSGNKGDDCATVKFVEGVTTYGALTLDTRGGEALEPMFIENGKVVGDIPTPVKAGSYFRGWYKDAELTDPVTASTTFTGDATIYAKWVEPAVATLHANGGTCAASVSFEPGTTPEIPTPTREDYTFIGWYTDETLETPYVSGAKEASFDLYAKWISSADVHGFFGTYSGFTVNVSSGAVSTTQSSCLVIDAAGNYRLRKYYSTNVEGTLGAVVGNECTASNSIKVVKVGNYLITFDANTVAGSTYIYFVMKDADPFKTGASAKVYNSKGIYFVEFADGLVTRLVMIDAATASVKEVTIKDGFDQAMTFADLSNIYKNLYFKVDDGVNVTAYGYDTSSSTITTTLDAVAGWYKDAENKILVLSGTGKCATPVFSATELSSPGTYEVIDANHIRIEHSATVRKMVTLDTATKQCSWADDTIQVTFKNNYDGAPADLVTTALRNAYSYFKDLPSYAEPKRSGYKFDGWYTLAEGGTVVERISPSTEDVILYAHWVSAIDITFHYNNGSADEVLSFPENSTPTITDPVKDGQMFAGWYTDAEFNNKWNGVVTISITDLYAKFEDIPTFVGTFYGYNSDHDGIKLYSESNKSPSTYYTYSFTADGKTSGKASSTWLLKDYDPVTGTIVIGNNSKIQFVTADDGTIFEFADYSVGNNWPCDDDFYIGIKADSAPTVKDQTLCWLNGYQKISKITVNDAVHYVYINGYNKTTNPSGGFAYVDVTFKDGSGNPLAFEDLASTSPVSFAHEINIYKGSTLVGACGGDGSTLVMNDMKAGTYTGTINGEAGSMTFNGYGVASVTVGAAEPVEGTYQFTSSDVVKVSFGGKDYNFTVNGFNITQILDGFEGTYAASDGKTITLTGYGVASVKVGEAEPVAGTYTVSGTSVYVTAGGETEGYAADVANKTLTVLPSYTVVNGGSSSTYKWVYDADTNTWSSNNKGKNSTYCAMTITANKATTVVVTYWCSSESATNWDYFHIDKNGTKLYTAGGSSSTAASAVTQTIELAAGDVLVLKYEKDSSSAGGSDTAYMTKLEINGVQYVG